MSDWEESDKEETTKVAAAAAPSQTKVVQKKSKWEGEDEEDDGPASDWEESSEEEEKPSAPASGAAPPKKKGTIKAKIAEKEAQKAAKANDVDYDSDDVLDPREKARRDKEKELNADLNNAAELFGSAALGGTSSSDLDSLISFQPRTKEDFQQFSAKVIEYIIKRHQDKPLYASFVEHHVKELAAPLKDVEVRKAASGLTTLANEKQKEQRTGKKKPKAAAKPVVGSMKAGTKFDTRVYDEALDDIGDNDDFM